MAFCVFSFHFIVSMSNGGVYLIFHSSYNGGGWSCSPSGRSGCVIRNRGSARQRGCATSERANAINSNGKCSTRVIALNRPRINDSYIYRHMTLMVDEFHFYSKSMESEAHPIHTFNSFLYLPCPSIDDLYRCVCTQTG